MYFHTLEDKRYLQKHVRHQDFPLGFHFSKFLHGKDDVPYPCPKSMEGLRNSGVAGRSHVPANITDKKTATAICEYLNANPEPKTPFLTPAVLDRALTALGYGTLEEYLAPKTVAAPIAFIGDYNRYIRQSKKGTFTVSFRGVSIPQLPSRQAAIDTVNAIRQGFAINAEDVRAYAIAATQLEDLA